MKLRIVKSHGTVSFELGAQPVALSRLRVLNSHGVTMWDLVPVSVRAVPIDAADMVFVELPQSSAGAVLEALKRAVQDLNAADEQPEQAADPIIALSGLIAARQQSGELPDQTATAALEALRELGHSWKEIGGAPGQLAPREGKHRAAESRSSWAGVSRVSYGEIPDGYRQLQEPRPLAEGESYSVVVLGAEAFNIGRDSFVA
jgi:hypothetical protein